MRQQTLRYFPRHYTSMISGRVISTEKEVVDFATVYLKGTNYGSYTDEKGIYHLKTVEGEYILVVSAVGYQTVENFLYMVHILIG